MDYLRRNPTCVAEHVAQKLRSTSGVASYKTAIILGSGWGAAADQLGSLLDEKPVTKFLGFAESAIPGHAAKIQSRLCGQQHILVFLGRTHLYEGHGAAPAVHRVRVAAAAGCGSIILTNACGGLKPSWRPGTVVVIRDHINLTGVTPLSGPQFLDQTHVYSPRLRELCRQLDPSLEEGVFVQKLGPEYETPSEIDMIKKMGGHLIGMSTAIEAIAARAAGLEVLGLSMVTNAAAGMSGTSINHQEVLEAGKASADRIGQLLAKIINHM